jgi:uncharacterized protein (TIGR03437 family)
LIAGLASDRTKQARTFTVDDIVRVRCVTGDARPRVRTTTVAAVTPNRPCTLTQKPAITSVLNGASFQSPIGPGAIISIFGSNFAGAATALSPSVADFLNNGYPRQLACVAVEVNGTRVPLTYVSRVSFAPGAIAATVVNSVVSLTIFRSNVRLPAALPDGISRTQGRELPTGTVPALFDSEAGKVTAIGISPAGADTAVNGGAVQIDANTFRRGNLTV